MNGLAPLEGWRVLIQQVAHDCPEPDDPPNVISHTQGTDSLRVSPPYDPGGKEYSLTLRRLVQCAVFRPLVVRPVAHGARGVQVHRGPVLLLSPRGFIVRARVRDGGIPVLALRVPEHFPQRDDVDVDGRAVFHDPGSVDPRGVQRGSGARRLRAAALDQKTERVGAGEHGERGEVPERDVRERALLEHAALTQLPGFALEEDALVPVRGSESHRGVVRGGPVAVFRGGHAG